MMLLLVVVGLGLSFVDEDWRYKRGDLNMERLSVSDICGLGLVLILSMRGESKRNLLTLLTLNLGNGD